MPDRLVKPNMTLQQIADRLADMASEAIDKNAPLSSVDLSNELYEMASILWVMIGSEAPPDVT